MLCIPTALIQHEALDVCVNSPKGKTVLTLCMYLMYPEDKLRGKSTNTLSTALIKQGPLFASTDDRRTGGTREEVKERCTQSTLLFIWGEMKV